MCITTFPAAFLLFRRCSYHQPGSSVLPRFIISWICINLGTICHFLLATGHNPMWSSSCTCFFLPPTDGGNEHKAKEVFGNSKSQPVVMQRTNAHCIARTAHGEAALLLFAPCRWKEQQAEGDPSVTALFFCCPLQMEGTASRRSSLSHSPW